MFWHILDPNHPNPCRLQKHHFSIDAVTAFLEQHLLAVASMWVRQRLRQVSIVWGARKSMSGGGWACCHSQYFLLGDQFGFQSCAEPTVHVVRYQADHLNIQFQPLGGSLQKKTQDISECYVVDEWHSRSACSRLGGSYFVLTLAAKGVCRCCRDSVVQRSVLPAL